MPNTRFAARDLCRPLCRTAIICSLFVLSSCDTGKTPFATDVHRFNEQDPQQPAAITISDPQIYARETLINDRLRERRLLADLLKETENVKEFREEISKPGLIRDMETLEAFLAAADVNFDQVAGLTAKREQRIAELDAEVDATNKRRELVQAQTELTKAENDLKAAEEANAKGAEKPPEREEPADPPDPPSNAAPRAKATIADLRGRITQLQARIDRIAESFGERTVTVPIPDAERMRDAYRAELRHRLNAVNLDDLHDHDGNSLFRLQFKAAVMPGQYKDKVGVARLTFLPPVMSDQDISATYFTWLTHLANRLNTRLPEGRRDCPLPAGSLLQLQHAGLVEFVRLDVEMSPRAEFRSSTCPVYVPLPPRRKTRNPGFAVTSEQSLAVLEGIAAVHKEDWMVQSDMLRVRRAAWNNAKKAADTNVGINRDQARIKGSVAAEKLLNAQIKEADAERKAKTQAEKDQQAKKSVEAASAEDASAAVKARADDQKAEAAKAREEAAAARREADAAQKDAEAAQREADLAAEALGGALDAQAVAEAAMKRYAETRRDRETRQNGASTPNGESKAGYMFINEGMALGGHEREVPRRFIELVTDGEFKVSKNEIPKTAPSRPGEDDPGAGAWVRDYPDFRRSRDGRHDRWDVTSKFDQSYDPADTVHVAAGVPYAYATTPLEKSQLISTSAKAARSMELALSAVASIQTAGVAGGLDLGYVRESAGIAEAFENKPIVIGFSDRNSPVEREQLAQSDPIYLSTHQAPQVGWVFGPKVQMDTERNALKLVHGFAAHEVSADLSIPGWWPHVRTILETAWIGNLHNTGRPIRLEDETGEGFHRERFVIKLPVNAADLDGLTAYLARNTVGALLPIIDIRHVEPYWLSACTQKVEILVKGFNVWRSSRAFLGGVEADQVSVLPDMEGVAARFDMDKIFATRNEALQGLGLEQGIRLTLWTRNGEGHITMGMEGVRTPGRNGERGSCIARTAIAASRAHDNLAIVSMSPAQICASATKGVILVRAYGVGRFEDRTPPLTAVIQNAEVRSISRIGGEGSRVYRIEFDGGPFGAANRNLELSLTDGYDMDEASIRLVDCKTSPVAKPKTASAVGPRTLAERVSNTKHTFEIGIKGLDPTLDNDSLRVAVLPILPAGGVDKYTEPVKLEPVTGTNDTYKADISFNPKAPSYPDKAFNQPRRLRYVLLQALANSEFEKLGDVNGSVVYYPNKDATKVGVSVPSEISRQGSGLTFTLPIFLEEAYPTLRNSRVLAEVKNKSDVKLNVELDWGRAKAGSAPGTTDVPGTIKLADEASLQVWKKEPKGDKTFDLKVDGGDMPAVASFVFKKETDAVTN